MSIKVPFPTPLGPQNTTGRGDSGFAASSVLSSFVSSFAEPPAGAFPSPSSFASTVPLPPSTGKIGTSNCVTFFEGESGSNSQSGATSSAPSDTPNGISESKADTDKVATEGSTPSNFANVPSASASRGSKIFLISSSSTGDDIWTLKAGFAASGRPTTFKADTMNEFVEEAEASVAAATERRATLIFCISFSVSITWTRAASMTVRASSESLPSSVMLPFL
mmetsp:Transcript_17692/g.51492  ORF Transcript_17692/g.51492 Transcript_17692/m.51492 type:complete len:222 (+) Transcript_17692:1132-1797(+)